MPVRLALAAALAVAPADDGAFFLNVSEWRVPAECPAAEVLRAQVRRSLAGLVVAPEVHVRASVHVVREAPRRYRLELVLDAGDGPGERTLIAEQCAAVIDTAAWLIAITLDGRATDPAQPATPMPEPPTLVPAPPTNTTPVDTTPTQPTTGTPESTTSTGTTSAGTTSAGTTSTGTTSTGTTSANMTSAGMTSASTTYAGITPAIGTPSASTTSTGTTSADTTPAPPRGPTRALHLDLWAGGGFGLRVLPAATAVAGGGLVLSGRRWQVELGGQYWARRGVRLAGEVGGRFAQGHASLRGCAAWELGRARLSPCGGLALGGLMAAGSGPVVSRTARSLWVGLLVGAQVWLRLHARVRLGVQGDVVVGLRRPGFTFAPEGTLLFRPPVVGFYGLLALLIRLR